MSEWGTNAGADAWSGGDAGGKTADDATNNNEDGGGKKPRERREPREPREEGDGPREPRVYETKIVEKEDGTSVESYVPTETAEDQLFKAGINQGINFDR
jgi:hypothetical protein